MSTTRLPRSLLVVAILFILEGAFAIYRTATQWSAGHTIIPLDVISIFIGIGLLRGRNPWRRFAVGWLCFCVVLMLAYLTWFVFSDRHATVTGSVPAWLPNPDTILAGYFAVACLLGLLGICILTSRQVVSFYEEKSATSAVRV
jgi:hypothetical protein